MDFNVSKCNCLTITTKCQVSHFQYTINSSPLTIVSSSKYLRVTVDGKLSWGPHVAEVTAKAINTLGLIKRTLYHGKPFVKTAYEMLVRPKLEYTSCLWSPHTQKYINKLEKVQQAAARFVKNYHRRTSSVTSMMPDLNWKTLEPCRAYQQLIMFY